MTLHTEPLQVTWPSTAPWESKSSGAGAARCMRRQWWSVYSIKEPRQARPWKNSQPFRVNWFHGRWVLSQACEPWLESCLLHPLSPANINPQVSSYLQKTNTMYKSVDVVLYDVCRHLLNIQREGYYCCTTFLGTWNAPCVLHVNARQSSGG